MLRRGKPSWVPSCWKEGEDVVLGRRSFGLMRQGPGKPQPAYFVLTSLGIETTLASANRTSLTLPQPLLLALQGSKSFAGVQQEPSSRPPLSCAPPGGRWHQTRAITFQPLRELCLLWLPFVTPRSSSPAPHLLFPNY